MATYRVVITETVEYNVEALDEREALSAAKSLRAYDYAEDSTLISGPTVSYTIGAAPKGGDRK